MIGTRSLFKGPAPFAVVIVVIAVVLAVRSCFLSRITISVTNTAAEEITAITVTAEGDKTSWPTIEPGQTQTGLLSPQGFSTHNSANLYFKMGITPFYWVAPKVRPGKTYSMEIQVMERGIIQYRVCVKPCSLKPSPFRREVAKVNPYWSPAVLRRPFDVRDK